MDFFRLSGEKMTQLKENFENYKTNMEEANSLVSEVYKQIETEKEWTGESADTFMAYLNLMCQYQEAFMHVEDFEPLSDCQDALKELEENLATFYTEFSEFKEMENI